MSGPVPFRISVKSAPAQDPEATRDQVKAVRSLGLQFIEDKPIGDGRVAVCGGGNSIRHKLDEIREFDEVWAVNGTCSWLIDRGIKAKLFSVDPQPELAEFVGKADEALLATCCHPKVFEMFDKSKVRVFDIWDEDEERRPGVMAGASTTASFAPRLAVFAGYRSVHFFGCDSSFDKTTHVDRNETFHRDLLDVRCGTRVYRTNLGMMKQAEYLSGLILEFPTFLFNHSFGLLEGMLKYPDTWGVVWICDYLDKSLTWIEPSKEAA